MKQVLNSSLCMALVIGGLTVGASTANAASYRKTGKPQILDVPNDANFLNDGGYSYVYGTPFVGNVPTPTDTDDATDLLDVSIRNDVEFLYIDIHTQAPPDPEMDAGFFIHANIDRSIPVAPSTCLEWWVMLSIQQAFFSTYQCTGGDPRGRGVGYRINRLADGTGMITVSTPLNWSTSFQRGAVIHEPATHSTLPALAPWTIDTTVIGSDYVVK